MNNSIEIVGENCCGCTACVHICSTGALEQHVDDKGFLSVFINNELCIGCHACISVCPIINSNSLITGQRPIKVLSAKNRDKDVQVSSTSGGVFLPLASYIIGCGGVVFGSELITDNWREVHTFATDIMQCKKYQKSKYIQSDISACFDEIVKQSPKNKVLFTGTPCQVAAIKSYISNSDADINNVFFVEILCYGVPSPGLFNNHIELVEKRYRKKIINYNFRQEQDYTHRISFDDGSTIFGTALSQAYGSLWQQRLSFRASCFSCPFASDIRCADISIGDCWGIEYLYPAFTDKNGVSQVLINTEKGSKLWNEVKDKFDCVPLTNYEELKKHNPVLVSPATKPTEYKLFWDYYRDNGYAKAIRRFTKFGVIGKAKFGIRIIKSLIHRYKSQ